ncbi:MAG: Uma2 family endonuclease [Verrucomicrobiales bacterium]|nr:Uma2 family endonuclease [Verrucomicrobiales bacterium]
MIPQTQTPRLTEAEYLAIERAAPFKSEFFDGEMFAMAGGTPMHSLIGANLIAILRDKTAGRGCLTFTSDLRVKVEMTGLNTYPDVSVVCDEMRFADSEEDTLVNPTLLAEVLSDATEGYDRGEKFEHYRRIGSLQAYLLVSQRKPRLELFLRGAEGHWVLREAAGLEASLEIPPIGIALPLLEVFANVKFVIAPLRPGIPERRR